MLFGHIVNDDKITIEMIHSRPAWIGIAVADSSGRMIGNNAVVALPDDEAVRLYKLGGKSSNAVSLLENDSLTDAVVLQNETHTTLRFTRPLIDDNDRDIFPDDGATFIIADGFTNRLGTHRFFGSFRLGTFNLCNPPTVAPVPVPISPAAVPVTSPMPITTPMPVSSISILSTGVANESIFVAHGYLMAFAWGLLVPLAIGMSLLRDWLPGTSWIQLHAGINTLVTLCTIIGLALSVYGTKDKGVDHFSYDHAKIGLSIVILVALHVVWAVRRPHLPHAKGGDDDEEEQARLDDEQKSKIRVVWEYGHRIVGLVTLALAWYNCDLGIDYLAQNYRDGDEGTLAAAFWGVTASLAGVIVILTLVQRCILSRD